MSRCMEEVDARINLMVFEVGVIAGPNRTTLRQLQSKYLVDIFLPRYQDVKQRMQQARAQQDQDPDQEPDAQENSTVDITVRGYYLNVFNAIEEIHSLVPQGIGSTSLSFLFPTYKHGIIIGKGGQTIKRIKSETKGILTIVLGDGNPEVRILGTRVSVRNAYEAIHEAVLTFEANRENILRSLTDIPYRENQNQDDQSQEESDDLQQQNNGNNFNDGRGRGTKYRGGRGGRGNRGGFRGRGNRGRRGYRARGGNEGGNVQQQQQ